MGLSDQERYNKIVWSIREINRNKYQLNKKHSQLISLIDDLWYEFLKRESNSCLWLFGSEFQLESLPELNLISNAFENHSFKNHKEHKHSSYYNYYKAVHDLKSIINLLEPEKRTIVKVYIDLENIIYSLKRYNDEFLEKLKALHKLTCKIKGELYDIISRDSQYSLAWMIQNLCKKLLTHDENDIVNQWWQKKCIHHHININQKYDDIFDIYKKYQFKEMSLQERLDTTLILISGKHDHKDLIAMIETYNKNNNADLKINIVNDLEKEPFFPRSCEFTKNYTSEDGKVHSLD